MTMNWIYGLGGIILLIMLCIVIYNISYIEHDAKWFAIRFLLAWVALFAVMSASWLMSPHESQAGYIVSSIGIIAIGFFLYMRFLKRLPRVEHVGDTTESD